MFRAALSSPASAASVAASVEASSEASVSAAASVEAAVLVASSVTGVPEQPARSAAAIAIEQTMLMTFFFILILL